MTEIPIRTIKVYDVDAAKLTRLYGGPQWRAFRLALAKAGCEHPEPRTYTTALIRTDGMKSVNAGTQNTVQISGFYCHACRTYVFPHPRTNEAP